MDYVNISKHKLELKHIITDRLRWENLKLCNSYGKVF